jgi:psp operon transcriptional activator
MEDILLLAENFAMSMARELEFELFSGFTEKAKRSMLDYHWPGNVRELKNVVERSVYRCNNPHLPVHDLVIDPFESPYRPSQRIKTQDRQPVPIQNIDDGSVEEKRQEIIQQQIPASQSLEFPLSLKDLSQDYEIDLIKSALENCQYNQKKTADALKLTYHQLRGYLKKYNLLESAVDEG